MKNKKINELKKQPNTLPSIEEQQAFIDELVANSKKRIKELDQWMIEFKIKHGIQDEIE